MTRSLWLCTAALVFAAGVLHAQDPNSQPADPNVPPRVADPLSAAFPDHPKAGFTAKFAKVMKVDKEGKKLELTVIHSVAEQRAAVRTVTVKDANGNDVTKEEVVTYVVTKPVFATVLAPFDGATIVNQAGKRLDLAQAVDKLDLAGREVFVIEEDVDPFYKKFLAPQSLFLTLSPKPIR